RNPCLASGFVSLRSEATKDLLFRRGRKQILRFAQDDARSLYAERGAPSADLHLELAWLDAESIVASDERKPADRNTKGEDAPLAGRERDLVEVAQASYRGNEGRVELADVDRHHLHAG